MQVGFHPYIELSTFIISGKCGYWCLKHLTKTPFFSLPSKRKYFICINQDCEAFEEKLNHCGKYQHGKPPNCPDCHLPLQEGSRNESTAGQSIDRIYHCYFFSNFWGNWWQWCVHPKPGPVLKTFTCDHVRNFTVPMNLLLFCVESERGK